MSGYVPNAPKGYRDRGVEPVDLGEQRWAEYKDLPAKPEAKPGPVGCVFAKSCTLPNGVINHSNPGGFVPVELLKQYGTYAVLGTGPVISAGGTPLQWVGGSGSASGLVARLGGTLALAGSTAVGFAALLLPDDTSADSAFYTFEQYAQLSQGNTRVRVNVKHLPDGSVSVYGFYTGTKAEWQQVPVIEAKSLGDQLVADLGNGTELIWTPAADPNAVLGIPTLEGALLKPGAWVFPPTEQADKILVNPVHPPDYQDAIIWFPNTGIQPIYISLILPGDHSYYPKPKSFPAFPGLKLARPKTRKKGGGLRDRWKDKDGTLYEWDSQHGALEKYNKRGKHLGEFDPITGRQTKPADRSREIEP
ncbi:S-type pyocin domain-containing protein [Pseudomonas sp. SK3(2021)]|uniref:colicin E3/pyocin S6 family cytotoxin n=1 Tax=Pseudomonas sp. SK3(2021) TaxID=2841064 RepID=UPI00192A8F6C|nr:colicin E3/pyocin S6 family cytotoxin [Pseudomonas sp. SK3(2021)]QQZ44221.1 S-type pyocin domain-containing protein [Pseudomonas sp. SK3(2021)]